MFNDICIDIDYSQLYKHGQKIGGDVYFLEKNEGENIITATLSDGLGSGVKANVLATLTSHMATRMSFAPIDLQHSAEIIMDTLPVDKEKGISYSTFTMVKIGFSNDKSFINASLVEYDNPESLRFSGNKPVEWEKTASRLKRKTAIKDEIIYSSSFNMFEGDRLIFFSDGVAQAGVSLGAPPARPKRDPVYGTTGPVRMQQRKLHPEVTPQGWGETKIREFVQDLLTKRPAISSRDLTREIVTQAYKYDGYHPNDDITCAAVYIRKPRRTLIITGAPRSRESDKKLRGIIEDFEGNVIVCGGTTAKIVARELGKEVKADRSPSGDLPPASLIEGVDLVTEGMLTLSAVSERLRDKTLLKDMTEDPAKRFIKIMRDTDQVQFIVGTKINDDTDDPATAAKIGVRFPLIDQICQSLRRNYLKEVEVSYL